MVHEVKPKMPWNSMHGVSEEMKPVTPPPVQPKPVTPPTQVAPEMTKAPTQVSPEMMKAPMQVAPEMMKAPVMPETMEMPMNYEMPQVSPMEMNHEMPMTGMMPMQMEHEMPMTMPMTGTMPMMPMVSAQFSFQMMYPVVYYRALPYIMMACDEMEMNGNIMPTQDVVDNTTGRIYDEMVRMYPDLDDNDNHSMMQDEEPTVPVQRSGMYYRDYDRNDRDRYDRERFDHRRDHRRDRHRGNLGNLLQILLLSELFRRRRRY